MFLFSQPTDILNRALQHLEMPRIWSLAEATGPAQELAFMYDKLRRAELRRNVWKFATRRTALYAVDATTYRIVFLPWLTTNTYTYGHVVLFNGIPFESQLYANLGNQPDQSPAAWRPYFGPTTADLWQAITGNTLGISGYWSGDAVYVAGMPGLTVFKSLQDMNTDTPYLYPAWSAATTYSAGDTAIVGAQVPVFFNGTGPQIIGPGGLPEYFVDTSVAGNGLWESAQDMNINHVPGTDGAWVSTGSLPAGRVGQQIGQHWLAVSDATLTNLRISYPIGVGPRSDTSTLNIFPLPANHIRRAPQQKVGNLPWLGAPVGNALHDWEFTDKYIVSASTGPLIYRFVTDVIDVAQMDDMFCEGLAARIALEAPTRVIGHPIDKGPIRLAYEVAMREARLVAAVEQGALEPVDDTFISVRA